jgi:hypothetical protein
LAISKGIDRDRAVDESGNQLAVFGRRGARPLNRSESAGLYLRNGQIYKVTDEPEGFQKPAAVPSNSGNWLDPARFWVFGGS